MLALTLLYVQYGGIPQVSGVLKGLGAAVVAVILSAVWRMGKPHLKDIRSAILMIITMLALLLLQVNVVLLVIIAGLAGLALFRKSSDFPVGQKKAGVRPMKGGAR